MISAQTMSMVATCKRLFGTVETISTVHADRLLKLLDRADRESLVLIYKERIKFCWMPAATRLRKMGVDLKKLDVSAN